MSAPESHTSADQALSSLMGAVVGNPDASQLESAPVVTPRDWKAVQAAIDDYLEGYELRLDEGCHTPTEFERFLLVDAVAGLMHDDEFIDALYSAVTAARAAPAASDALPTIKGAAITGGYVVVTPAGWGEDTPQKVRDSILRLFPVDPTYTPKPEAAQQGKCGDLAA